MCYELGLRPDIQHLLSFAQYTQTQPLRAELNTTLTSTHPIRSVKADTKKRTTPAFLFYIHVSQ